MMKMLFVDSEGVVKELRRATFRTDREFYEKLARAWGVPLGGGRPDDMAETIAAELVTMVKSKSQRGGRQGQRGGRR
jgi:hypothetical protein